jgi:hypothetical protein
VVRLADQAANGGATSPAEGLARPLVREADQWANEGRIFGSRPISGRPLVRMADHDRFAVKRARRKDHGPKHVLAMLEP